jgi:hypothetical protein
MKTKIHIFVLVLILLCSGCLEIEELDKGTWEGKDNEYERESESSFVQMSATTYGYNKVVHFYFRLNPSVLPQNIQLTDTVVYRRNTIIPDTILPDATCANCFLFRDHHDFGHGWFITYYLQFIDSTRNDTTRRFGPFTVVGH